MRIIENSFEILATYLIPVKVNIRLWRSDRLKMVLKGVRNIAADAG